MRWQGSCVFTSSFVDFIVANWSTMHRKVHKCLMLAKHIHTVGENWGDWKRIYLQICLFKSETNYSFWTLAINFGSSSNLFLTETTLKPSPAEGVYRATSNQSSQLYNYIYRCCDKVPDFSWKLFVRLFSLWQ